jgi:hypothetical protein
VIIQDVTLMAMMKNGRDRRVSRAYRSLQLKLKTKAVLNEFCRRYHIRQLSLFGSTLRGEQGPESDIDLLVVFTPGHVPGFFTIVKMEEELTSLMGRKVDLRTPEDLSRHFRDEVVASAEVLYAEV